MALACLLVPSSVEVHGYILALILALLVLMTLPWPFHGVLSGMVVVDLMALADQVVALSLQGTLR